MFTGFLKFGREAVGVLLVSSMLVACGGGGANTPPPPVSVALAISPTSVVLDAGMIHTFSATGGEAPYTYDLASGAGAIDASSGVYTAASAAGATTVRVSDHAGHTATAAVTVNGALGLTPAVAAVAVGATLKLTPTGGTAPYTLALDSGGGSFDQTTHIYTAPAATGTATVSVTDTLGSKATATVTINSGLVAAAPSFTLTASSGQTYPIPVSGGTSPLTYSVTSGTGTVDANGVYTAGTKAGYEEVQITDAHGVTSNVRIHLLEALTNGQILSMISDSSGIYVGGIFSTVHPHVTSRMAALDATSGKLNLRCDLSSGFDTATTVMLVVGNSLYVGGPFTHYQGRPAHALVKLDAATCALDPQFTQATGFDGFVSPAFGNPKIANVVSLATDGTSLFVGGDFSSYRGQPAFGLAKLDLTTGNLDQTFTQPIGFNNAVGPIVASADALYVYGFYSSYRGTNATKSFPLKLNTRTGDIDPVFKSPLGEYDTIICMALSGTSVYVGGNFSGGLSKLDATTGAPDPLFQGNVSNIRQQVRVLLPSAASLYVGGLSIESGGAIAGHIAKIDAITGMPDPTFNRTDTTANSGIWSLATSGDSVYIAGVSQFGEQNVPGSVAKLDAATGALDSSFGDGASFYGGGPTAILASGNTLYLAGTMVTYGGIAAQNVVKFDPMTGVADGKFLSAGGAERAVTKIISSGSSLYVAGGFSTFGGVHAPVLAKVDPVTGMADSQFSKGAGFEGELNQDPGLQGSVRTMALSGNSLFVGGVFQYYRGLPLVALAKIDALTGDVDTTFNQASGFAGTPGSGAYNTASIQALALSGSSLYVSGTYTSYRGTPTFILSKLDSTSGALDTHFVTYTGMVFVLPYSEIDFNVILPVGNNLYVGGGTLPVPGGLNNTGLYGVGKFDATTGAPDMTFMSAGGVAPNGSSTPLVFDLVLSGTSLYIGGDFTAHNSNNLAKLDAVSGALDTIFTQELGANDRVYSVAQSGNSLRVSGAFTTYRSGSSSYSAVVDRDSGNPISP